ncbi:hypothetical protein [Butyrivibrio sp. M55]|uniref:hypothetical protein n=1 Tax=Butyrivibrio sp. M55 TaxID=1855323 RepID=UPI0008E1A881|nr:hypothetical protein [Butyrivibrio sp. M55]SFU42141.1 hypothetical protein SAMN05216540_10223 [Butyrivibrio sp. M55]
MIQKFFGKKYICILSLVFVVLPACFGCSKPTESAEVSAQKAMGTPAPAPAPFDNKEFIEESSLTSAGEDPAAAASEYTPIKNYDSKLSVPTYVTQINDIWFIVDCYHNRVIYSDSLEKPLEEWDIMTSDATRPHTIASDGNVYMIDDTDNNRVLIFEKVDDKFIHTQSFYDIGIRPHYTVYDEATDTFYVWSSMTGELFCFRTDDSTNRVYLTDKRKIDSLDGIYIRSFSIIDGDIYLVSGVSEEGAEATVLQCDLATFEIKQVYAVPDELAGMVQITKIQDYYYISVSTDKAGNQDVATIVRTKSLEDLAAGEYEDIYSTYFLGGGTPYYISSVGDTYFLTEHRLTDHALWSFKVEDNEITDVQPIF